jgi:uncharacterized membrane protein YkoI
MIFLSMCLSLLVPSGCSQATTDIETGTVALDHIPAAVMEVARKELPGVKFEHALKFKQDGEDVYEIKGKTSAGKRCEIEVSASGKVLEIE